MSKSILIIDTPNNCLECMLSYDSASCQITGERFWKDGFNPDNQILHNCPLKPVPDRINLRQYVDNTACNLDSIVAYQYAQGWNSCIDEILEEKE